MRLPPIHRSLLLLGALVAPLHASDPGAARRSDDLSPNTSRLDVDQPADGTTWVRGDEYKARFDARGVRYIPFLGSDAPRNYPLDLRLQSVRVGGVELEFDAEASPVLQDESVVFDRGAFLERYLLTPQGIEQTFEFHALPMRGEIVLGIAVETELASHADADGFRFENARGHVRYGRAFVFDAGREKEAVQARLGEREISIVVPAARVHSATLPLIVDPVLSTYNTTNGGPSQFAADTAFDTTNSVYFTVMEEIFSASDHDVRGVRHTENGGGLNIRFIDTTDENWTQPKVANNRFYDQFLVVAAVGAAPTREIHGRTVSADAGMAISAALGISGFLPGRDAWNPDVGGDSSLEANTRYCVVWQENVSAVESAVAMTLRIAPNANSIGSTSVTTGALHKNPCVSNSNGTGVEAERFWNIAFESEVSASNHDLAWRRMDTDGWTAASGVLSSPADERKPSTTAALDESGPWMIAYQTRPGSGDWDVATTVFEGAAEQGTLVLTDQFPSSAMDQFDPTCDTDGRQFAVAYVERATPLYTSSDIKLSSMFAVNGQPVVNEGNLIAAPGIALDSAPSVASRASSGSSSDNILVVFDNDSTGQRDVFATIHDLPDGGPVVPYCFGDGSGSLCPCLNFGDTGHGCANSFNAAGAMLSATGNAGLGVGDSLSLHASGMPPTATCYFFQGTSEEGSGNGVIYGDGLRCVTGSIVRLGTKTASGGSASYPGFGNQPVSVRGLVPATGATRYYQVLYRNSASFCAPSGFNLTNGLRVTWLP